MSMSHEKVLCLPPDNRVDILMKKLCFPAHQPATQCSSTDENRWTDGRCAVDRPKTANVVDLKTRDINTRAFVPCNQHRQ